MRLLRSFQWRFFPKRAFQEAVHRWKIATDAERWDDAARALEDVFALAEEQVRGNPSPDWRFVEEASACEHAGDWEGAEAAYHKILALSGIDPPKVYKAHADLYWLCRALHRDEEALAHTRMAVEAARSADWSGFLLAMALRLEAGGCLLGEQVTEAKDKIAEGLAQLDNDRMSDHMRAQFLVLRARCALAEDECSAAANDLKEAFDLLRPQMALKLAAGVMSTVSSWWETTAQLRTKLDDHDGAVEAWREALAISRSVSAIPHAAGVHTYLEVAKKLAGLAAALFRQGCPGEAQEALDESDAMLQCANVPKQNHWA